MSTKLKEKFDLGTILTPLAKIKSKIEADEKRIQDDDAKIKRDIDRLDLDQKRLHADLIKLQKDKKDLEKVRISCKTHLRHLIEKGEATEEDMEEFIKLACEA